MIRPPPAARRAYDALPDAVGGPLRATVERLDGVALGDLAADYVETFDSRRRHNLFLTYFAHGDTRKRGVALLRFKQTYLAAGFEPAPEELPDHLCLVLEFAATIGPTSVSRRIRPGRRPPRVALSSPGAAVSNWSPAGSSSQSPA